MKVDGRTRGGSLLPTAPRAAMTLLELMLVLALLVMIGALAMPAMRRPFENFQLRKAGDLVRVQWAKARIRAMKTGQMQMFQFVPGERSFGIQPYATEQDYLEADLQTAQSGQLQSGVSGTLVDPNAALNPTSMAPGIQTDQNRQLPEGVVFYSGLVKSDTRSMQIQQQAQGTVAMESGGVEPILFYPDGTTSDAVVSLTNQQSNYVRITLRGLTGVTKVSPLMTAEEWQQIEQAVQTTTALQ